MSTISGEDDDLLHEAIGKLIARADFVIASVTIAPEGFTVKQITENLEEARSALSEGWKMLGYDEHKLADELFRLEEAEGNRWGAFRDHEQRQ